MNYAELIKQLLDKLIVSQTELAEILNVSFASVNRWATGKFNPTTKSKRKIIELCKKEGIVEE